MNTAGNLFWTNVTKMLKENNESLRSVALYMRDGVNDKKTGSPPHVRVILQLFKN